MYEIISLGSNGSIISWSICKWSGKTWDDVLFWYGGGRSASRLGWACTQRTWVCQSWAFGAFFNFFFAVIMCSAVSSSYKPLINPCVGGTSLRPVSVSAAWRSTCCRTARRGSTSVTSAPKLLTGSPTWYGTKCLTTAGSTTSVKTVPRYSEFIGCLALLMLLDTWEHGSGDAWGWDAGERRASAMLQTVSQGFTLLLDKYVGVLPLLIWKWLWRLKWALMQDAEHPRAQGLVPCEDWWGVRGSLRGKKPQGNATRVGSLGCVPALGTRHFRTLLQYKFR